MSGWSAVPLGFRSNSRSAVSDRWMMAESMCNSSQTHFDNVDEQNEEFEFVSDQWLLQKFVTPQMLKYFQAKMPDLDSEILVRRICELLKYLMLVRFSPGRILFGKDIDDIWHYWILQTRQYAELCEKLPGKSFRHHSSTVYEQTSEHVEKVDIADAVQRILSFFISYYRNFGPITEDQLECWPTLQQVTQETGWDMDQLNDFLRGQSLAHPSRHLVGRSA
jgi:hypothetical protein